MAILIKQDGSQELVRPVNGRIFSQQEIELYGSLGFVLMGCEGEMGTPETRPEKMESTQ